MTEAEWKELEEKSMPKNLRKFKTRVEVLLKMTEKVNEHPESYNGPCFCRLCMSYADA